MGDSKPIEIHLLKLITALQMRNPDAVSFLDLQTGEVKSFRDGKLDGKTVALDVDRYRVIKEVSSKVSFKVMKDFITGLPNGIAKQKLHSSIGGRKPFRAFKEALRRLNTVEAEWYQFEAKANEKLAQYWLEQQGIHATLWGPITGTSEQSVLNEE